MSNFILYILMFGLGALWMHLKCTKLYNSDTWKAKQELELAKIKLQTERIRAKVSNLLDEQISGRKNPT
jgi:hypothetical protein